MKKIYGVVLVSLASVSCGKKKEDSNKGKVNLNFKSAAAASLYLGSNSTSTDLGISTSASSNGLSSMKMYFREIKICTSLKFTGTAYTIDGVCASVYTNMQDDYTGTQSPTAADRTRFAAAGTGKFYDVLSSTDRAALTTVGTGVEVEAGDYNYGIIETHPWVKFSAKSGTLCTKNTGGTEVENTGSDGIKTYTSRVDSLECGSGNAEETLMYITNANTTFKFNKAFSIAKDGEFTVDLAFNLDSEVRAGNDTTGNLKDNSASRSFYVPMIRMGAAPRKSGETTKVETYTLGTTAQKDQLRVQFYYNSADTTKSILGINTTVLTTAASVNSKANKTVYGNIVSQTGDTVSVKNWEGNEIISFTRGAAGTATLNCSNMGSPAPLEECEGKTSTTFTYVAPTTSDLQ